MISLTGYHAASSSSGASASSAADWLQAIGTIGAAIVTGIAVYVAFSQIRQTRNLHRKTSEDADTAERRIRVDQYLARLADLEFLEVIAEVINVIGARDREHRERAKNDFVAMTPLQRLRIFAFFNFFEEMSGAYRSGLLHEEAARNVLVTSACHYWDHGRWFIEYLRESHTQQKPPPFGEWEQLVRDEVLRRWMSAQRSPGVFSG